MLTREDIDARLLEGEDLPAEWMCLAFTCTRPSMAHANARTNLFARRLGGRVPAGWPAAHVAKQLGLSRATVYEWLRRDAEAGAARPGRPFVGPQRQPARTPKRLEQRVLAAPKRRKRGAVVLAAELRMSPSTVGRIQARHGVAQLAVINPITGQRVRLPQLRAKGLDPLRC